MSQEDPPRLRTGHAGSEALALALDEARNELPSRAQVAEVTARLRARGALGAPAGVLTGAERAALSRARATRAAALVLLATTLGVGATIGLHQLRSRAAPAPGATAPGTPIRVKGAPGESVPAAPATGLEAPPPPEAQEAPGARSRAEEHAAAAPPRGSAAAAPTASEAPVPSAVDLPPLDDAAPVESESALLGRAQHALRADPAHALELAHAHAAAYPHGALEQERDFIVIEALVALGRTSEATSQAAAFRSRHPGSAHLRRVDLLVPPPGGE
jgi:hypothetical protein